MRGGGPATGTVNSIHCSISIPKRKAGPLGQGAASSSKSRPFIFRWKSMPLSQAGQRIWPQSASSALLHTYLNLVCPGRANFMLPRFSRPKSWMTKIFRLETCCKTRRMQDAAGAMRLAGHHAPPLRMDAGSSPCPCREATGRRWRNGSCPRAPRCMQPLHTRRRKEKWRLALRQPHAACFREAGRAPAARSAPLSVSHWIPRFSAPF